MECYNCEDAEIIIAAYGTMARIAKNVIQMAEEQGIKIGLIRPITLWPFPLTPSRNGPILTMLKPP